MTSFPPLKIAEETVNIHESLATVNEPVNFNSTKNMVYHSPYETIRIEKGWTPNGQKIMAKLSGKEENFKVSLPKRYVEIFRKLLIDNINHHAKSLSMTLLRKQGTVFDVYIFATRGDMYG